MTSSGSPTRLSDCPKGLAQIEQAQTLTDFTPATEDLGWYVLNDNVMGGRSEGGFVLERDQLLFGGATNTYGGGFSSIRTRALRLDLTAYTGIRLRVLGDGRRYTWRLTSRATWRGQPVGYWASFDTRKDVWITVDIPFSRFVPRFRGVELDGPLLDVAHVTGMGLMIYDKRDGPFELRLSRVHAYVKRAPITLAQHRWNHRVLVLSAPAADDANLGRMRREVAATDDAFTERDMTLVTLLDHGTSTAGSAVLTTEEVACLRSEAGVYAGSFAMRLIGKDGGIKRSSDIAVSIEAIYKQIDAMPMRQSEARERSVKNQ